MGKSNIDNRKKAVQKTAKDKAVAITCIVLAILIVAVIAVSVLNEFAVFDRINTVVETGSGEVKVNKTMMSFFLSDTIMNWYSQYGGYSSLFSVNLSYDLRAQQYGLGYESMILGEFSGTWYDYFLNQTLENVKMYVVYADAAKLAGLTLSEQDKIDIDTTINNIKASLKANNSNFSDQYGKGVNEGDVRDCYELIYLASAFMEYKQDQLEKALDADDAALHKYVDEHKEEFYSAVCLKYTKTVREQSYSSAKAYQNEVDRQKKIAELLVTAKTPAEFIDFMDGKASEETTSTETTTGTATETATETTGTATETTSAKETLSPEEILESQIESRTVEIEYSTGTGALEEWLFGSEWASEGEVKYFEETGSETKAATTTAATTTKTETTTEKETSTETETSKAKTGESTAASSETTTETETKAETETKKVYKTYKVEVYYVLESCDKDYEFVHNFAYLVVDDEAVAKAFKEEFEKGEKTMDAFVALAEKKHDSSHGEGDHDHSDKTFEFNKFEKQPAGAFNTTYNALNKWIEDDARKAGDVSDIITVTTTDSNNKAKKTYAVMFFEKDTSADKQKGETWYVNAYNSTVSYQFEEWYKAQLVEKPLNIDTKGLGDINHIVIATTSTSAN